MGWKDVEDLSVNDAEELLDLFVHCCAVGAKLNMPASGMAGTLLAFSKLLEERKRPLQYYVDNPRGDLGRPVNEAELAKAKAETQEYMTNMTKKNRMIN